MRQQFERGQTIYTRQYAGAYRKGIVADPDVVRKAFAVGNGRNVHYVSIAYVDQDGAVDMKRTWHVLNNRRQIIDETEYTRITQAKDIAKLRGTIEAHRKFEARFALYTKEARIITEALPPSAVVGDTVRELALYLCGMFSFRYERSRQTRIDVQEERGDLARAAAGAGAALEQLGEEAPELVKEAGA